MELLEKKVKTQHAQHSVSKTIAKRTGAASVALAALYTGQAFAHDTFQPHFHESEAFWQISVFAGIGALCVVGVIQAINKARR